MRLSKPALSIVALAFGIAACASNPDQELTLDQKLAKHNYTLGKPVDRVEDYRIMGFNSLDDFHVIILSSPTRSYLVTTRMRCYNLDTAENLAFSTTVGSLTDNDKLIVRSGSSGYTEQCYISSLMELNKMTSS